MSHGHKTYVKKCPQTGKTGFASYDVAMSALRRVEDDGGRVYNCQFCGLHHFTRWSEGDHVNSMANQPVLEVVSERRPIPADFLNALRRGIQA